MRLLLAIVVVVTLSALAWMLVEGEPAGPPPDEPTPEAAESAAQPELIAAGSPPPAPAPAPVHVAPERATGPAAVPAPAEGAAPTRLVLRVNAHGHVRTKSAVTITVTGASRTWVAAPLNQPLGEDGTSEFRLPWEELTSLRVKAEGPAYLPAKIDVDLETLRHGEDGVDYIDAVLELTPARIITGRLADPAGKGLRQPAVAVFALVGGKPQPGALDTWRPGSNDREPWAFALRVREQGRYLVAAVAEERVPAAVMVDVSGPVADAGELSLSPGQSIEGIARFMGRPLARSHLSLRLHSDNEKHGTWLGVAGRHSLWHDGSLLVADLGCQTDEAGRFRIDGLARTTYALRLASAGSIDVHDSVGEHNEVRVVAPASVDLDIQAVLLRVEVTGDSPRNATEIEITAPSVSETLYGVKKMKEYVAPGTRLTISAAAQGFKKHSVDLTVPTGVEEFLQRLALAADRQPGILVATFTGSAKPVSGATFAFYELGTGSLRHREREFAEGKNVYRVTGVPPGRCRMVAQPGGSFYDARGYYLPIERVVEIPEGGQLELTLPVKTGGLARFDVRGAKGAYVAAACAVTNARGDQIHCPFVYRSEGGGTSTSFGGLVGRGPCETAVVLVPGRYEARLTLAGYHDKVLEFTIEAGRTTRVQSRMESR